MMERAIVAQVFLKILRALEFLRGLEKVLSGEVFLALFVRYRPGRCDVCLTLDRLDSIKEGLTVDTELESHRSC
jgi:hypothetical protein